jgi:hypothetical protein
MICGNTHGIAVAPSAVEELNHAKNIQYFFGDPVKYNFIS